MDKAGPGRFVLGTRSCDITESGSIQAGFQSRQANEAEMKVKDYKNNRYLSYSILCSDEILLDKGLVHERDQMEYFLKAEEEANVKI